MKAKYILLLVVSIFFGLSSCSPKMSTRKLNAYTSLEGKVHMYDEMTMDLDEEPITYVIDISTEAGRLKLQNLSLDEACDLALVEAIMSNKCAAIFQPQYTHLVRKGKVLRVTLYGYPARYKKKAP